MRCIQLSSWVGCSRVPQVHFVQKQTLCKSLYTYLTICFAFEKPRWLLHNTAARKLCSAILIEDISSLSKFSEYPSVFLFLPCSLNGLGINTFNSYANK